MSEKRVHEKQRNADCPSCGYHDHTRLSKRTVECDNCGYQYILFECDEK